MLFLCWIVVLTTVWTVARSETSNEIDTTTTTTTTVRISTSPPTPAAQQSWRNNFTKGYFGGYYLTGESNEFYYSHGAFHSPGIHYYSSYKHKLQDESALGYYLGYALRKMNHNEYFKHHNFTNFQIHHYYYMNNIMLPEQYVGSDHLDFCAQNTSTFCPENTEPICLLNATVWCASKVSFVERCEENDVKNCVTTRLPCVRAEDRNCINLMEVVKLPCISRITILDAYADKNGLTFNHVAGTFVLAPVPPVSDRSYCVVIVAEPV